MANQTRLSSSVGVKPLTSLTDDELVMKQTGKSSDSLYKKRWFLNLGFVIMIRRVCDKRSSDFYFSFMKIGDDDKWCQRFVIEFVTKMN